MEQQENEKNACCYKVKIAGLIDEGWGTWLDCVTITCEITEDDQSPVTILTYLVTDQPALRGLLNKLFDLNLKILSVARCDPDTGTENFEE